MKKYRRLFILFIFFCSCRTTRLDNATGDYNPTWNKRHLDMVHKIAWRAGNDVITPAGFVPVKTIVKK